MAVRVESFVPHPFWRKDEFSQQWFNTEVKEIDELEAQRILRKAIQKVTKFVENRRIDFKDTMEMVDLFEIGADPLGEIPGYIVGPDDEGYKLDKGKLQNIGVRLMNEFGFDPETSQVIPKEAPEVPKGVVREIREFPSATIKDLRFVRWMDYLKKTGQPLRVHWQVWAIPPQFDE